MNKFATVNKRCNEKELSSCWFTSYFTWLFFSVISSCTGFYGERQVSYSYTVHQAGVLGRKKLIECLGKILSGDLLFMKFNNKSECFIVASHNILRAINTILRGGSIKYTVYCCECSNFIGYSHYPTYIFRGR